jgi:hypothetical protein
MKLFNRFRSIGIPSELPSWPNHVNSKFKDYERRWAEAYERWKVARDAQDAEAMVIAFEEQGACLLAEQLAHADMLLPEDQQKARWDFDYLAKARADMPKKQALSERLDVVEAIMASVPR